MLLFTLCCSCHQFFQQYKSGFVIFVPLQNIIRRRHYFQSSLSQTVIKGRFCWVFCTSNRQVRVYIDTTSPFCVFYLTCIESSIFFFTSSPTLSCIVVFLCSLPSIIRHVIVHIIDCFSSYQQFFLLFQNVSSTRTPTLPYFVTYFFLSFLLGVFITDQCTADR